MLQEQVSFIFLFSSVVPGKFLVNCDFILPNCSESHSIFNSDGDLDLNLPFSDGCM